MIMIGHFLTPGPIAGTSTSTVALTSWAEGGVMFMLSERMVREESRIRYEQVVPGCILRVYFAISGVPDPVTDVIVLS